MTTPHVVRRVSQAVRWRLGLRVAAAELEEGSDGNVQRFYSSRVTDCTFLEDAGHYEFCRGQWVLSMVNGGSLLEVGCGNGGMTRLLAPRVGALVAVDASAPSLDVVRAMDLPNVTTAMALLERFEPSQNFDCIVMSEVIEHLRHPQEAIERCASWLGPSGSLLVTTPNGHWDSNEHLHEFDLRRFAQMFTSGCFEQVELGYLRDGAGKRRWLVADARAPALQDATSDVPSGGRLGRRG